MWPGARGLAPLVPPRVGSGSSPALVTPSDVRPGARWCRVGGGDSFASGLVYGFLAGKDPQWAVDCGAAHGALAMTTPGDTTMASQAEVERVMKGGAARVQR